MISSFSIAKALLDNAQTIATANNYTLIPCGTEYTPDPNATYIEEFPLFGDDTAIGLADESSDIQFGVYQLNINTPKDQAGSKWAARIIEGVFKEGFKRGTELTHNGQMLRTRNSKAVPMDSTDTHDVHVLSISYSVIN